MSFRHDILIVVRSKRKIVSTLDAYRLPFGMHCVLLSDPSVYDTHRRQFKGNPQVTVVKGVEGLGAQAHRAYRIGYDEGYEWIFRMDDDLHDKFFIASGTPRVRYPTLDECIKLAYKGANALGATLVGFANTSRLDWLGTHIATTYGGIHGAAQLHCTSKKPDRYIDPTVRKYEDVWRTCAHRHRDGVARVQLIGMEKGKSSNAKQNQTTVKLTNNEVKEAIDKVNRRWPQYVVCKTTTTIHAGTVTIPHWHFYRAGHKNHRIDP